METYKYQVHTHTTPCSRCGAMTPKELVESLYNGGFKGCIITNHFINGHCGIDRSLSWNEFVKAYEDDFLECKKEAEKYDIDILFGVEEHVSETNGLEILCYGITPEMLYKHPELRGKDCKLWCDTVHSYGGLCIQSHPFRQRAYIPVPGPLPLDLIDGIEVYNACNNPEDNVSAEKFAAEHPELILVSGADAHSTDVVCYAGIETKERLKTNDDVVRVLKSKDFKLIKTTFMD